LTKQKVITKEFEYGISGIYLLGFWDIIPICIVRTLYVFHSGAEGFLHYNKKLLVPERWLYLPLFMIGREKSGE
jgi:hypothetical protein